jgi:hypothetical protein
MPDTWFDQDLRDDEAASVARLAAMGRVRAGWVERSKNFYLNRPTEDAIRDHDSYSAMDLREAVIRLRILSRSWRAGNVAIHDDESAEVSPLEVEAVVVVVPVLEAIALAVGIELPE